MTDDIEKKETVSTESQSELDSLNKFLEKKHTKENINAFEAQKLVNLFRTLSAFRESFVPEYNKMLLNAPEDVQMMIPSIVGGPIVRQYLEHLQKQRHLQTTQNESKITKGYLPSPEDEAPVYYNAMPKIEKKLPPFPLLKKNNG